MSDSSTLGASRTAGDDRRLDSNSKSETFVPSRNGVLCGLLVVAFILACRPMVEVGYIDDWSMARTARVFADTGHFAFNGWAPITENRALLAPIHPR